MLSILSYFSKDFKFMTDTLELLLLHSRYMVRWQSNNQDRATQYTRYVFWGV